MAGPLHVCKNCGLVYIRERRTSEEVADDWTGLYQSRYSAVTPSVETQHTYLGACMENTRHLRGRRVLDVGGGKGHFAKLLRDKYGAVAKCLDPSPENAFWSVSPEHQLAMRIEEFPAVPFDIICMNFTLENCADPSAVLKKCHDLLAPDGLIFIQTGARIAVPFSRHIADYLSMGVPDTHPLRFSPNTLVAMLARHGFRYQDMSIYGMELLWACGKKDEPYEIGNKDDWQEIIRFFDAWHNWSLSRRQATEGFQVHSEDGVSEGDG